MTYGEIFNTDEPEPWPSAEDEDVPDSCSFCGDDLEEDTFFFCGDCKAVVCSSDCAEGHREEECPS